MHGAAHKPGAIPLRPLTLGSFYDGAFRIIRFNPKATVGAAALVTAVANLVPVLVAAALTVTMDLTFTDVMFEDPEAMGSVSDSDLIGVLGIYLAMLGGAFATWFGLVFVTGMVAHVAHAAAVGRKLTLKQAWDATHGKRWRLVGLNLLLTAITLVALLAVVIAVVMVAVVAGPIAAVLAGLLLGVAFIAAMLWFWIKVYYLPVPALMLEDVGVLEAIQRGYRLTADQYWRILGIAMLTYLITTVAGQFIGFPIALASQLLAVVFPDQGWILFTAGNALSYVVMYAFIAPFTAAVISLQYIDQRIRKEAHDVELMREAGLTGR
jgi:hypothetical protein